MHFHVYVCMYVYTYIHTCIQTNIHAYTHFDKCKHAHTYMQALTSSKKAVNASLEATGQRLDPEYYSAFREHGNVSLRGARIPVCWLHDMYGY